MPSVCIKDPDVGIEILSGDRQNDRFDPHRGCRTTAWEERLLFNFLEKNDADLFSTNREHERVLYGFTFVMS